MRITDNGTLIYATQAAYSYESGLPLSQTDVNGQVTAMTYDNKDRVLQVTKMIGGILKGATTYYYSDTCDCVAGVAPYAEIKKYLSGGNGVGNGVGPRQIE